MLAELFNTPSTPQELMRWSFAHNDAHVKINVAIFQQKGVALPYFILDPMPQPQDDAMANWQQTHQEAHSNYEGALGIPGNDLSSVDFTKEDQVQSWLRLHAASHIQAQQILGYPD